MVRVTKVGSIDLRTVIDGQEVIVDLSEVHYAENLADNIIRYGALEECGIYRERHSNHSYLVRQADKMKIFQVFWRNNILILDVNCELTKDEQPRGISSAVLQVYDMVGEAVIDTTLLELHQRLGHLSYDTVVRMADSAGSGIRLTDLSQSTCLRCTQGKQSKNNQSEKIRAETHRLTNLVGLSVVISRDR